MRLVKILTVSFCIIILLTNNIFALGEILSTGEKWEQIGKDYAEDGKTLDTAQIKDISSELYNLLLVIATATALIVGAILGIQFMTAGIDKKVEVQKSLFPYLISCVVVFGSLGIWKLTVSIVNQIK